MWGSVTKLVQQFNCFVNIRCVDSLVSSIFSFAIYCSCEYFSCSVSMLKSINCNLILRMMKKYEVWKITSRRKKQYDTECVISYRDVIYIVIISYRDVIYIDIISYRDVTFHDAESISIIHNCIMYEVQVYFITNCIYYSNR